jgi:VanZ family protein
MRTRKRDLIWCWLPVLLWMAVIFTFSSQSYPQQDIRPWIKNNIPVDLIRQHFSETRLHYGGSEVSIRKLGDAGFVEFFIRKGAHLAEYALLGFLIVNALRASTAWSLPKVVLFTFALAFFYAVTDEIHQIYTYLRTPKLEDVWLDSVGTAIGIMVYLPVHFLRMSWGHQWRKRKI